MIAIIDYKAGNLTSVKKAFDHVGAETVVTADAAQVVGADKVVLPGVGHFQATTALDDAGLRPRQRPRDGVLQALTALNTSLAVLSRPTIHPRAVAASGCRAMR